MSEIEKECIQCEARFTARSADHKRGRAKFCSLRCSSRHQAANKAPRQPNVQCANCGIEFYRNDSKKKRSKSGLFFCGRSCKNISQRIGGISEVLPSHYGTSEGYRVICFRHHKKECVVCGEDKIVAVHHYDENHDNNEPGNLVPLCPTHHQYVHSKYKSLVEKTIEEWVNDNCRTI